MRWKGIVLPALCWLLAATSVAQQKETTLKGYLGVEGGESYTYKLVFTDSSGFIKGHAYTYLYEQKEVKAAISGYLDRTNRTLTFSETSIVYNHGFESHTTICLIRAVLKLHAGNDGNEVFSGAITSSDIGNVYCGQGTVSFPAGPELKALFLPGAGSEAPKKDVLKKPSRPVKIIYDTASAASVRETVPTVRSNEPEKITAGVEKVMEWHSDTVIIEVWDGGIIDGDNISVHYNDRLLLNAYTLTKDHKRLTALISPLGTDEVVFTANHEGNQPPMTANAWLIDGSKRHEIVVYNAIGQKAVVKIRRVKK